MKQNALLSLYLAMVIVVELNKDEVFAKSAVTKAEALELFLLSGIIIK